MDRPPRSATRRGSILGTAPPFIRARPDPQGSRLRGSVHFRRQPRVRGGRCDRVRRSLGDHGLSAEPIPPSRKPRNDQVAPAVALAMRPRRRRRYRGHDRLRQQSRCCRCVAGPRGLCRLDVRRKRSLRLGQAIRESARCADDGGRLYLSWLARPDPAHSSSLFTAGIWLSDSWTVLFVLFLLSFPEGRLNTRFDLVILAMFAIVAFPLEFLWLLFFRYRAGALRTHWWFGRTAVSPTMSTRHSALCS